VRLFSFTSYNFGSKPMVSAPIADVGGLSQGSFGRHFPCTASMNIGL